MFLNKFNLIIINYPYIVSFLMVMIGFYILLIEKNLIKKVVGLNLLQGGIIVFYVLIGKIKDGVPPIYNKALKETYSNPIPHVLMLTAIVVGIATTSLACAFIYRIYKNYNTLDEQEIIAMNNEVKE